MDAPIKIGEFLFVRDFDSANLGHVERVSKEEILSNTNFKNDPTETPTYEFNVWTKPDCAATEFENGNRTWFYFGLQTSLTNTLIKLNIVNLNRQGKMYSQGMAPVTKTVPGKSQWERIKEKPTFYSDDNIFTLSFKFRTSENKNATTFFAFTYPYSYSELQTLLNSYDLKFQMSAPVKNDDDIYYCRECVCYSLEKRRVDLITISSRHGITDVREKRLKSLFPENKDRPYRFKNKKVIFISARVHPGETPSSFVFNGILNLLVNQHDPVAIALRKLYVFKLIPFLNPDGVARGHYRTDTRGLNLNRMYLSPSIELHPTVFAARSLIRYHHFGYEKEDILEDSDIFPPENLNKNFPGKQVNWMDNSKRKKTNPIKSCRTINHSKNSLFKPKLNDENEIISSALNTTLTSKVEDLNLNEMHLSSDSLIESDSLFSSSKFLECNDKDDEDVIGGKLHIKKEQKESENIVTHSICPDNKKNVNNNVWCNSCKRTVFDLECRMPGIANMLPSCQTQSSSYTELQFCVNCHNSINNENTNNDIDNNETDINKNCSIKGNVNNNNLKLNKKKVKEIKQVNDPESGLFLYIDLHGHASKKGIFMYGNHFEDIEKSVDCMLLPRIMSLNNCHFHFTSCNFTERNMYLRDRRDGMSREGSGRVAVLKATGLLRSYTLECNYNTGRMLNVLPPTAKEGPSPGLTMPSNGIPPKYTPQLFEEVGKSLCTSILDLTGNNPNSRIPCSEHRNLNGIKEWLRSHSKHSRPTQIHLASSRQPSSTRTPRTPLPRAARSLTKTSKKSCFSDNERKENLLSSLYQLDARSSQSKISSNSRSNANLKLLGVKSRSEQSLAAKSQRNLSLIKKPSLNKQNFKQTLRKSSPSSRARIVQKLKLSEGSEVNKNLNSNLTESFKGASKSNSAKPKQSKLENLANELITNKSSSIPISSTVQKKLKLKIRDGLFQKQSHQYPNKSVPKRLKISQFIKYTDRSSKEKFNIRRNPSKEKVEVESISSSNSSAEDATLSWDTVYALSVAGSSSCASDAGPSTKRLSRSLRRPPLRNHQI